MAFLDASPTPFHAVATMRAMLLDAGFEPLDEAESWSLEPGGAYFVIRGDSALIAFRLGADAHAADGLRMAGAHTDSPCLKLKPNPHKHASGYRQFGIEVYGGVLLNPWFDRDLSVAGRVTVRLEDGTLANRLVDFERPIAVVPSLAIHLDREANESRSVNAQTMMPPVVALAGDDDVPIESLLLDELHDGADRPAAVVDFDLSLYDTQRAAIVGLNRDFLASARLDNLLSCFTGISALIASDAGQASLVVCNDHEEVGSGSAAGARGNFLESVLSRIAGGAEAYARLAHRSLLVSTDNAHGIHPNFVAKHDEAHGPLLNAGPVVKVNANQAYASSGETAALVKTLAEAAGVPLQRFASRADMGCGSTIGPLTATRLGIRTVDIGVPTFAMHSIRELAGRHDAAALHDLIGALFAAPSLAVAPAR